MINAHLSTIKMIIIRHVVSVVDRIGAGIVQRIVVVAAVLMIVVEQQIAVERIHSHDEKTSFPIEHE